MKKLNLPALLFLIISLASACRATDCGCPMSLNTTDEVQSRSHANQGLLGLSIAGNNPGAFKITQSLTE